MEKCLLEIDLSPNDKTWVEELDIKNKIIKEMKGLAMMLSRFKPADWNKFLDVVIKWIIVILYSWLYLVYIIN